MGGEMKRDVRRDERWDERWDEMWVEMWHELGWDEMRDEVRFGMRWYEEGGGDGGVVMHSKLEPTHRRMVGIKGFITLLTIIKICNRRIWI